MKMTTLMEMFLRVASTLQDMAFYMRPLVGIVLFSLSVAIIMFALRNLSDGAEK